MIPFQGGLPILHDGKLIGGVGASGAPSATDEAIVRAGLDALTARMGAR
jgi:glc operon protein GlcG